MKNSCNSWTWSFVPGSAGRQVLLFLAMTLLVGTATPQSLRWRFHGTDAHPWSRWGHAMAFDSARGVAVLFGGQDNNTGALLQDTWLWDGTGWTDATPRPLYMPSATPPPARFYHAMAYDSVRQRVLLFGGQDPQGNALNDTWEWNGRTWAPAFPATGASRSWGSLIRDVREIPAESCALWI